MFYDQDEARRKDGTMTKGISIEDAERIYVETMRQHLIEAHNMGMWFPEDTASYFAEIHERQHGYDRIYKRDAR